MKKFFLFKSRVIEKFLDTYFTPSLDLRVQAFNLLAWAGMLAGVITSLTSLATGIDLNILINIISSGLALFLVQYARKKNSYLSCYRFTIIVVFTILFPIMFFTAGGYHSGMPCFYVFAIIFTALMMEGRDLIAALAAEFIIYSTTFILAYFNPDLVNFFAAELDLIIDVYMAFIVVSTLLFLAILLYMRIYNNRQQQLEELDRLKTEFYQNMHHEMKTPLNVICTDIQNAYDMLDFEIDTITIKNKLESAQQEIIRLSRMVENSIDLAAAQISRRHMEPIDLADLLCSKAGAFRSLFKKKGNTLSLNISDDLPMSMGNADMLSQVIFNLLYNAHKHTRKGEINVSLQKSRGHLEIVVRDTGEGIYSHILPFVWERGVSANGTTGYGLSICKTIVEMHNGSIRIDSTLGEGTEVTFALPINANRSRG